jgi:hypothetical protein
MSLTHLHISLSSVLRRTECCTPDSSGSRSQRPPLLYSCEAYGTCRQASKQAMAVRQGEQVVVLEGRLQKVQCRAARPRDLPECGAGTAQTRMCS